MDALPSREGPHTAAFAPDRARAIRTGVAVFHLSALELLGRPAGR
jgi:hypothetical protein